MTYALPEHTREVLDSPASTTKGFGNTNDADFGVTSTAVKNVDLASRPRTGQLEVHGFIRTSGKTEPPYNAIKVTVAGKYGSGETFSTTDTVRISCP